MEEKLETVLQIRFKMLVFTSAWLKASVLEVGVYSRRRTDPREIRSDVARFPRCKKKFWSGALDARSHPGGGLRHQTSILSLRWTHICWTVCTVPHMLAYSISYSWNQLFIRQSLHIPGERCHPCTSLFTVISAVWVRGHAEEKGKKKTEKETRGSRINSAMIKVQTLGVRRRKIQNHHISFWLCGRFRWVFTLQVHSFNIFFSFQQPLIQQIIITTPRCLNDAQTDGA